MAVMYSRLGGCLGDTSKLGPLASTDIWAWVNGLPDKLITHFRLGSSSVLPLIWEETGGALWYVNCSPSWLPTCLGAVLVSWEPALPTWEAVLLAWEAALPSWDLVLVPWESALTAWGLELPITCLPAWELTVCLGITNCLGGMRCADCLGISAICLGTTCLGEQCYLPGS